ncbi:hypothetical protein VKT23_006223 [Stygiomarasmius scandens]|uniref:ubiquitinyl hydrolase 1 n=1 Tax=Marasmiellus scandens TaxID=2682957 RepID=A0ABR1JM60_9AGAR
MVECQRARRLMHYAVSGKDFDALLRELENRCIRGLDNPDWLLVQISSDFLARDIQVSFAKEMMHPSNSKNSVLQLNMGEGKSSVIVPLIASALPDGQKLVRVVVLKALSTQMFQLLVDRLSGLPNRQIFYLPFSRDLQINVDVQNTIQSLYDECMTRGGILLTQPEHLLSFRLMGIDRVLDSRFAPEESQQLLNSYSWLSRHSRDILDESDEILHVRYQLIYTTGKQSLLEDHPNRWTTVQELISLVFKHASGVRDLYPQSIHLQASKVHAQSVPVVIFLQSNVLDDVLKVVVSDIFNGALSNYPFERLPATLRVIAIRFIIQKSTDESDISSLTQYFDGNLLWKGLLLLRGLIAHGILAYCLQKKRWRVDYGLDIKRTLLAVPYRAKDVPASKSDFSHPDVAICLTCLSYYYGGLTADQVEISLQLLLKSDNPQLEYESWIDGVEDVPRKVTAINLKDHIQFSRILVPRFAYNRSVIDFYLSQIVFPKYALQYPEKMMSSGWDLVETKENFVTGFSGTKDSQYLLPATITQYDPLRQAKTTAQVVEHLLQPENDVYLCAEGPDNERLSAVGFLKLVVKQRPEIRTLLDIGAQILDLDNEAVGKRWLELNETAEAAVFFNKDDHMMVVDRQGGLERLVSSRYRGQLSKCVIYLDDAHTRGTDLKLPRDSRAAVTLGDRVTKDRLMQGCMRMRQLGRGQTVMFLAPAEIDRKIREVCSLDEQTQVSSSNVLRWSYSETVADIERHVPNWINQGIDYIRRKQAWDQFDSSGSKAYLSLWKQPEARTLEQMYGVTGSNYEDIPDFIIKAMDYQELRERSRILGWNTFRRMLKTNADEEQEREVSNEAEREQQVEKPLPKDPEIHQFKISRLIYYGDIPKRSPSFMLLTAYLDMPTIPGRQAWHKGLLCSVEFATTIKSTKPSVDEDMRSVTWIISGGFLEDRTPSLVLISPEEANKYRAAISWGHCKIHLHLYAPRVTQNQASFEDLRFYTIPPLKSDWIAPDPFMIMQLNLFSGQLYLRDWESYKELCLFLGLHLAGEKDLDSTEYESDGFIKPEHRSERMKQLCPFQTSPLPQLKKLFGARRKGSGYAFTHMGKILAGRSLERKDFE